ncbi:MAG: SEC-C domain-containing protein [Azonexus sp.]|nr:SEC-C domain-containing protein [Betaproteobacteria bacterium]MBP6035283.1 SEC-C domain-containing protein [Azonexus sp.]MBP6905866.1 SEC-C domain-containing protein [Azonexus sp.]
MRTSPDLDWYNAVEHLCHASAGHLLAGIAFPEFRNRVELLVGPLFDQLPLGQAARVPEIIRALATQAALEIWNATPIPANRFRPLKIAKPERNAPCPCASGRKYKQCCGAVPPPSLGIREETMLAQVIAHWPRKRLGELPLAELHPESLALVALDWQEEGSDMDAIALLEALFTHLPKLDGRAEHAADVLLDLYGDGSKSRKKLAFLEQLKAAPDKTLRSTAWQRQATLACDRGEVTAAWAAFGEAQRLTPNAPALSHLEVLLLLSEGRRTEARARADFWCARLARDGKFDHSSLIDTLRDMVSDDDEARLRNLALMDDPLGDVADISGDWTAPACHYTLAGGAVLQAKAPLARVEKAWDEAFDPHDPESDGWIDLLEDEPLAAQSFLVLRDLVEWALDIPTMPPGGNIVLAWKLLERAEALRRTVLARLKAEDRELPWGHLENRPLLTLAAIRVTEFANRNPEETLELLRWSVLVANPNDNTGLREILIHRLAAEGHGGEAVAIAERYPHDLAFVDYGRVLAYHAAGRLDEAAVALSQAITRWPKVWQTLNAARPRKPKLEFMGFCSGGDDEAWIYREERLEQWRQSGALRWAVGLKVAQPPARQSSRRKRVAVPTQAELPGLDD